MSVFKPQLSFDGVALIVVAIGFAVQQGMQREVINEHTRQLQDHETRIRAQEWKKATVATNSAISPFALIP